MIAETRSHSPIVSSLMHHLCRTFKVAVNICLWGFFYACLPFHPCQLTTNSIRTEFLPVFTIILLTLKLMNLE